MCFMNGCISQYTRQIELNSIFGVTYTRVLATAPMTTAVLQFGVQSSFLASLSFGIPFPDCDLREIK